MNDQQTKITILDNKNCQIISPDQAILKRLHNHLSYKENGVEFTYAFQNSGWNGITYCLSKTGKFSIGLLPKVKLFLGSNFHPYTIQDKRPPKPNIPELDISENLKKAKMIPREHQNRIVECAMNHERGIIRGATGLGKTLVAALIAAKRNLPTTIMVIGLDLLQQFHDLFSKLFDEPIGFIGNGRCEIHRINIASIWTIGRALKIDKKKIIVDDEEFEKEQDLNELNKIKVLKMLKETKLFILDESHCVSNNTVEAIYWNIDPVYLYGMSGTPFPDNVPELAINKILGEQIINVSASELIEKGLLATPFIKFRTVPKMKLSGDTWQTVYREYIVENEKRNQMIVDGAVELISKGYTPLVLFKQIKHGEILFEKMKDAGVNCEMLYGNDGLDRRSEVKEMIEGKEIDLVLGSTIYDLGVDIPVLSALILAGGGKSSVRCLQRIGRILRAYPGKKNVAVIDFFDQAKFVKKHSSIRCGIYQTEDGFKVMKSKEMK